jgi:3alpha(or 20beta)-hydroxysteroid dehydrogenase
VRLIAATAALASAVMSRFGAIDAVAHTAGAFRGGQPLVETPIEILDAMMRANFQGPWNVARAMLPSMIARGRGSLTLIAARAGLQGRPGLAAYCAAAGRPAVFFDASATFLPAASVPTAVSVPGCHSTSLKV